MYNVHIDYNDGSLLFMSSDVEKNVLNVLNVMIKHKIITRCTFPT